MKLRKGGIDDIEALRKLFRDTVSFVCKKDYDSHQIDVWKDSLNDVQRWHKIFLDQFVIVVLMNNTIIGFATLNNGNEIDLLYVHKDYQRIGVATMLYEEVEREAIRLNADKLNAKVSRTALAFFMKMGFITIKEQQVESCGIYLVNYVMTKKL